MHPIAKIEAVFRESFDVRCHRGARVLWLTLRSCSPPPPRMMRRARGLSSLLLRILPPFIATPSQLAARAAVFVEGEMMLRAGVLAAAAAAAAAANWATFSTSVAVYAGANPVGASCGSNATNTVIKTFSNSDLVKADGSREWSAGTRAPTRGNLCRLPPLRHLRAADTPRRRPRFRPPPRAAECLPILPPDIYAQLPGLCNTDNDNHGSALVWFSDSVCTLPVTLSALSYYGGYGYCARAAASTQPGWVDRNYVVTCTATPGGATSGWVVSLAVLLSLGAPAPAARARAPSAELAAPAWPTTLYALRAPPPSFPLPACSLRLLDWLLGVQGPAGQEPGGQGCRDSGRVGARRAGQGQAHCLGVGAAHQAAGRARRLQQHVNHRALARACALFSWLLVTRPLTLP